MYSFMFSFLLIYILIRYMLEILHYYIILLTLYNDFSYNQCHIHSHKYIYVDKSILHSRRH